MDRNCSTDTVNFQRFKHKTIYALHAKRVWFFLEFVMSHHLTGEHECKSTMQQFNPQSKQSSKQPIN